MDSSVLAPVLFDCDDGPFAGIVRLVFLRGGAANQGVGADGELIAEGHGLLSILIEGSAGKSDDDHDNAEVDDVSAITTSITVGQVDHGGEHVLAAGRGDDAAAPVK